MQRQLMSELIAWKSRANRKPLLLKGARQTGKTWLLNEFASQQYRNVIRFDFMLEPSTRSLFDGNLDPKRIISQIELLRGQTVTPEDTLIIFDEVQEAPRGITSLKYFNELAPEYHIVAAGSYMGLALRRENESFPVGKIDQQTLPKSSSTCSRNTLLSAVYPKLSPLSPRHATSSKPEGFNSKSSRLTNPILANMHPPASSSA